VIGRCRSKSYPFIYTFKFIIIFHHGYSFLKIVDIQNMYNYVTHTLVLNNLF